MEPTAAASRGVKAEWGCMQIRSVGFEVLKCWVWSVEMFDMLGVGC